MHSAIYRACRVPITMLHTSLSPKGSKQMERAIKQVSGFRHLLSARSRASASERQNNFGGLRVPEVSGDPLRVPEVRGDP